MARNRPKSLHAITPVITYPMVCTIVDKKMYIHWYALCVICSLCMYMYSYTRLHTVSYSRLERHAQVIILYTVCVGLHMFTYQKSIVLYNNIGLAYKFAHEYVYIYVQATHTHIYVLDMHVYPYKHSQLFRKIHICLYPPRIFPLAVDGGSRVNSWALTWWIFYLALGLGC